MSIDGVDQKPFAGDGPVWDRVTLYFPWAVLFGGLVFLLPLFRPIFRKFQERGALPPLTSLLYGLD